MLDKYDDILTVDDLIEILLVSRNSVYSLLKSNKIYAFKVGNCWRVPINAVKEYIGYDNNICKNNFKIR